MNAASEDRGEVLATVGVDLGATHFKTGWLGGTDPLEGLQVRETQGHRHVEDVLREIAAAVAEVREGAEARSQTIHAVGVGVPAVIDRDGGKILMAPNLSPSWEGFPLAAALREIIKRPVYILNDARSFTLSEARLGAARGVANVLGITVGTGVGGGIVLDGRLRFGPKGLAGEIGHMTFDPNGPRCGCGGQGCVEVYAAGSAIAAAALRPLLQGRAPQLRDILAGNIAALDARAVAAAASRGERECLEIFSKAGEALGSAIANVMKIADIERVVVGGGVSQAGEILFAPIRLAIRRFSSVFGKVEPELVAGSLEQAGATGAAIWARESLKLRSNVVT